MARKFIDGARTSKGERLFTSNADGDRGSKSTQKVYKEHKGGGGSSRVKSTYDPKSGRFK